MLIVPRTGRSCVLYTRKRIIRARQQAREPGHRARRDRARDRLPRRIRWTQRDGNRWLQYDATSSGQDFRSGRRKPE